MIKKNLLKLTQLCILLLLLTATACKEEYPELEDGIYAEFVTNKGIMVAKLTYDKTPVTVANFIALAEGNHPLAKDYQGKRYYDRTIFHRVIDQFMIQGGDPTGTGQGNPGYKFADEFHPDLLHDKPGVLSMANSGPATNGSQFFITEVPYPSLNNRHTVFGELVIGLDVQDSISNVKVVAANKPAENVVIESLNIIRKGSEAKAFDAPKVFTEEMPKVQQRQQELREEVQRKAKEEQEARKLKNVEAGKVVKVTLDEYDAKAKTLGSGLKMFLINEGNGEKPKEGSKVKVNYEGYFVDGSLFDSNVESVEKRHGTFNEMKVQRDMYKPMEMKISPDEGMIAGFKEAATLLNVGDKGYFYMPSHLCYGERGRGPIKPNTDLIFVMEMVEIVK
ncbi:MAG: peptidylprolyl isomerase [Bacteroidetes bacterium MedPE-SWsnd-G2]|nr:MAG: peptidylprolyl isomerase [Bacteroidetes bacterium MedPE-SWsnd-G2]